MSDIFERVDAMALTAKLWPSAPSDGSPFAEDALSSPIPTYTLARMLLLDALHWLRTASDAAQDDALAPRGTHMLLLRPALVSVAKAAWLVDAQSSQDRVERAARLIVEDLRQGAGAMRKAVETGGPTVFQEVTVVFERERGKVLASDERLAAGSVSAPPRDEVLIRQLGYGIDRYYGTTESVSDAQLLWNAASSLAHGERWYAMLTDGGRRARVAEILTTRSLDLVCSGVNVTSLGLVALAAERSASASG